MRRTELFSITITGIKKWRFAAATLSMVALCDLTARAQCPSPDAPARIEVIPPTGLTLEGSTCGLKNIVSQYPGCRIYGNEYSQPEAIYKVSLHEGNQVAFNLTVDGVDLALAMMKACSPDPNYTCFRSADTIGAVGESLFEFRYEPRVYFLNIDARKNSACGKYKLTVTGVNPVPDLAVGLTASPKPVVAGNVLTYTLSVRNDGKLNATEVKVTQTLPVGVTVTANGGCDTSSGTVVCKIGGLAIGASIEKKIQVRVALATKGTLTSTATAKANEGDQNLANNQKTDRTDITSLSALSHNNSGFACSGDESLIDVRSREAL